MAFVYILKCSDGSLYTGSAKDLKKRIEVHRSGKGAKYTRGRLPVTLVYYEEIPNFGDALRRERQIKSYPKEKKQKLFSGFNPENGAF